MFEGNPYTAALLERLGISTEEEGATITEILSNPAFSKLFASSNRGGGDSDVVGPPMVSTVPALPGALFAARGFYSLGQALADRFARNKENEFLLNMLKEAKRARFSPPQVVPSRIIPPLPKEEEIFGLPQPESRWMDLWKQTLGEW